MANNLEPESLSGKIKKYLNLELNADNVEMICQLLKSMKHLGYRSRVIQDIDRRPLRLFDTMFRRGDIKETDYSLLLKVLKEADLTDAVDDIQDIINKHNQQQHTRGPQFARPSDLPVESTQKRPSLSSPGFPSPSDYKRGKFSSEGRVSSEDSVYPDNGIHRRFYLNECDSFYSFQEDSKGLVAIINNFTNRERDKGRYRFGTEEDQEGIVSFFRTGRFAQHYTVEEPKLNLDQDTFDQFLDFLVYKLKDNGVKYNSFFLFVLSHGDENGVHTYCSPECTEPPVMSYDKITKKFSDCLPGFPKVFVIQACQGRFDNNCQEVVADAMTPGAGDRQPDDTESMDTESVDSDDIPIDTGPPDAADMLTAFATVKGYKSYRVKGGMGSWFIQKLLNELIEAHNECYYSSHLLDLLTRVQHTVANKKGKATPDGGEPGRKVYVKQMPCFQSSLRKKFYLLPPTLPYPY